MHYQSHLRAFLSWRLARMRSELSACSVCYIKLYCEIGKLV